MLVHVRDIALIGTVHADLDGFSRLGAALEVLKPRAVAVEISAARARLFPEQPGFDPLSVYREAHARYVRLAGEYLASPAVFEEAKQRLALPGAKWTVRQVAAMEAGTRLLRSCYGFELRAARDYVARHPGSELVYIDLPEDHVERIQASQPAGGGAGPIRHLAFLAENRSALDQGLVGFLSLVRAMQDTYYDESSRFLRRRYEEEMAAWHHLPGDAYLRRAVYDPAREPHMAEEIRRVRRRVPTGRLVAVVGATHLVGLSQLLQDLPHSSASLLEIDVLRAMAA